MANLVVRSCWAVGVTLLLASAAPAQPPMAPDAATAAKIKALQTERRDLLRKGIAGREARFLRGEGRVFTMTALDAFGPASRQLLDSELGLATTKAERIAAHQAHFARMQKIERILDGQVRAEIGAPGDAALAKAARLEAEIGVLRAGGKPERIKLKKPGK